MLLVLQALLRDTGLLASPSSPGSQHAAHGCPTQRAEQSSWACRRAHHHGTRPEHCPPTPRPPQLHSTLASPASITEGPGGNAATAARLSSVNALSTAQHARYSTERQHAWQHQSQAGRGRPPHHHHHFQQQPRQHLQRQRPPLKQQARPNSHSFNKHSGQWPPPQEQPSNPSLSTLLGAVAGHVKALEQQTVLTSASCPPERPAAAMNALDRLKEELQESRMLGKPRPEARWHVPMCGRGGDTSGGPPSFDDLLLCMSDSAGASASMACTSCRCPGMKPALGFSKYYSGSHCTRWSGQ